MQQFDIKKPLPHKPLFNPDGDTDVLKTPHDRREYN